MKKYKIGDKFAYYGNIVQYVNDDSFKIGCSESCVFSEKRACNNVICHISVYHGGYYKFLEIGKRITDANLAKAGFNLSTLPQTLILKGKEKISCIYKKYYKNSKYNIFIHKVIGVNDKSEYNEIIITTNDFPDYTSKRKTRIRFIQEAEIFLDKYKDLLEYGQ